MSSFHAYYADIRDPAQQPRVAARLRDEGLVTFSGITDRAALVAVARRLMAIRPHRDAGPDGVTVITGTQVKDSGYAAFTDAGLIPHTDGSSVPDPPGLLLLACQQPADEGGSTLLADGARIIGTLAGQYPAALRSLSAARAAFFGTAGGYLGPVCEPAGPGRASIRLRLDDLAWFSPTLPPPSRCCAPWSHSTWTPSGCNAAKACCSATPGGCTAGTATPATASCSASSATPSAAPASCPDSVLRPRHRMHRRHEQRNDRAIPDRAHGQDAGSHKITQAEAGHAVDPADRPACEHPVPASQRRLKDFRAEHPDVEIIAHGYWQAVIPEANGETIITRWDLSELLDKLDQSTARRGTCRNGARR